MIGGVYYSMSEIGVAIREAKATREASVNMAKQFNLESEALTWMLVSSEVLYADKEKNHPDKISACNGGCYFKNG